MSDSGSYTVGDTVILDWEVRDEAGVLTNATVDVIVTLPDGATADLTPTNPSTGKYRALYPATQNGGHVAHWTAAGAVNGAQDVTFTVGGLVDLAQVKAQLDKESGTVDDAELQVYADAVQAVIEGYCGPVVPQTVTEWHNIAARRQTLVLRAAPVVSVTSVTGYTGSTASTYTLAPDPVTASPATYYLDGGAGFLTLPLAFWPERVKVTYVTGRQFVPPAINLAARLMVQDLWRSQNGASGLPSVTGESPDMGYAEVLQESIRSPRIRQLLDPYRRAPGIA